MNRHEKGRGLHWLYALAAALLLATASGASAGVINADTWYEFAFSDPGVAATGCDPADPAGPFCISSSGTPTTFLDAPPWTFVAPAGGTVLQVTDAFQSGDRFEVFDLGVSIGLTSAPLATAVVDCGDDPVVCLATAGMSTGTFALGAGAHSITLVAVLSPNGGGAGYLQIGAATNVPEPGALALLVCVLLALSWFRSRATMG